MIWSNCNHLLLFKYLPDYDSQNGEFKERSLFIVRYKVDMKVFPDFVLLLPY